MDFVACKIALGGDPNNVLYRGPDVPVSWPEVRVLQQLHGEDNVFDCEFAGSEPSTVQAEKMRLLGLYGTEAVGFCYPGARPAMEMEFPGDRDPIAIERPKRNLVADIKRSEPEQPELPIEPTPVMMQDRHLEAIKVADAARAVKGKRQPAEV